MNYEEAKIEKANGSTIYRAFYDGEVWSAGRMVAVGDTIGFFKTEEEARKACSDFELFDFDKDHCYTDVEICGEGEFED